MKKVLSIVLVLAMAMTMFVACGSDSKSSGSNTNDTTKSGDLNDVKKAGKLIIGITEYDPMNYYDTDGKTLIGFDTEFAQAVCKELGVEASFQIIDWETKETTLKAKTIDCIWNGLTVTEDRKANMDFSNTYLLNKQCVVINKKNADKFKSTADLKDAMISAESGSAGQDAIEADENLKNAKFTGSEVQMSALTGLLADNFDAVVLDYTLAKANCGNGDYADLVIVDSINLANEEYAIGFRLGSDLTAEINKITDKLVKDGTLAAIADKYDLRELYDEANK